MRVCSLSAAISVPSNRRLLRPRRRYGYCSRLVATAMPDFQNQDPKMRKQRIMIRSPTASDNVCKMDNMSAHVLMFSVIHKQVWVPYLQVDFVTIECLPKYYQDPASVLTERLIVPCRPPRIAPPVAVTRPRVPFTRIKPIGGPNGASLRQLAASQNLFW